LDQGLDFLRRFRAPRGEISHLRGNDRKAAPLFTGAGAPRPRLSASRFVWKAISSMTLVMSAIFFEEALIHSSATTAALTTLPPRSACSRAAEAS